MSAWSNSRDWQTGGGFSRAPKKTMGSGRKTAAKPVAEVPVEDQPEVKSIDPDLVQTPAELAWLFADSVRSKTGEVWQAPWWVQSWFADKLDWQFEATIPNGPSWNIPATPQIWTKVILAFFRPNRPDPAIGGSGSALWNEFKYWVRDIDLFEQGVATIKRAELSAKTHVLLKRCAAHGITFSTDLERWARADLHAAEKALMDADLHQTPGKGRKALQRDVEDAEGRLTAAVREQYAEIEEQGVTVAQLMEEHQRRKIVAGSAQYNVRSRKDVDLFEEDLASGAADDHAVANLRRLNAARKAKVEAYMASDEGQQAVEDEIQRLLDLRDSQLRRAGGTVDEDGEEGEEDLDPDSFAKDMEALRKKTTPALDALLALAQDKQENKTT